MEVVPANVLILTENKMMRVLIEDALKNEKENITVAEIGGHVLETEREELNSTSTIILSDNRLYRILGEEIVNQNLNKIRLLMENIDNKFDCVINACNYNKNGRALFSYAYEQLEIPKNKTACMPMRYWYKDVIIKLYKNIIK